MFSLFWRHLAICVVVVIVVVIAAVIAAAAVYFCVACAAKFSSGQVFHYHDFHHSRKPARQRFQRDFE